MYMSPVALAGYQLSSPHSVTGMRINSKLVYIWSAVIGQSYSHYKWLLWLARYYDQLCLKNTVITERAPGGSGSGRKSMDAPSWKTDPCRSHLSSFLILCTLSWFFYLFYFRKPPLAHLFHLSPLLKLLFLGFFFFNKCRRPTFQPSRKVS